MAARSNQRGQRSKEPRAENKQAPVGMSACPRRKPGKPWIVEPQELDADELALMWSFQTNMKRLETLVPRRLLFASVVCIKHVNAQHVIGMHCAPSRRIDLITNGDLCVLLAKKLLRGVSQSTAGDFVKRVTSVLSRLHMFCVEGTEHDMPRSGRRDATLTDVFFVENARQGLAFDRRRVFASDSNRKLGYLNCTSVGTELVWMVAKREKIPEEELQLSLSSLDTCEDVLIWAERRWKKKTAVAPSTRRRVHQSSAASNGRAVSRRFLHNVRFIGFDCFLFQFVISRRCIHSLCVFSRRNQSHDSFTLPPAVVFMPRCCAHNA